MCEFENTTAMINIKSNTDIINKKYNSFGHFLQYAKIQTRRLETECLARKKLFVICRGDVPEPFVTIRIRKV